MLLHCWQIERKIVFYSLTGHTFETYASRETFIFIEDDLTGDILKGKLSQDIVLFLLQNSWFLMKLFFNTVTRSIEYQNSY